MAEQTLTKEKTHTHTFRDYREKKERKMCYENKAQDFLYIENLDQ